MTTPRCPRCGEDLAFAKLRPDALPLGPDGTPLPGPYRLCAKEGLVVSYADGGDPVVLGPIRRR